MTILLLWTNLNLNFWDSNQIQHLLGRTILDFENIGIHEKWKFKSLNNGNEFVWLKKSLLNERDGDFCRKPHPCQDASKIFTSKQTLYQHIQRQDQKEPILSLPKFHCVPCPTECSSTGNLLRHLRNLHSLNGKFKCICNTSTSGFLESKKHSILIWDILMQSLLGPVLLKDLISARVQR